MTTLRTIIKKSVEKHPDNIALIEGKRQHTFKEFVRRSRRMGNALLDLGLKKGDRVAVLSQNSIESAESYFSLPNAGLILVMLNPRLAPPEILSVLSDADVRALIVNEDLLPGLSYIQKHLDFIEHFILIGKTSLPQGWHGYESLMEGAASHDPPVELKKNDLAALMYTSGTTGIPKGCMITHHNFYHVGQSMFHELTMDDKDRGIVTTPLFHASGMIVLISGIYSATPTLIMPRWNAMEFLRLVEKYRITTGVLATPMLLYLLEIVGCDTRKTDSLKKIIFAGAPVTPIIFQKAIERFGNIFIHGFGTTETVGSICILRMEDIDHALHQGHTHILSSCGKAYTDMDVQVVNGHDRPISSDRSGEIRVRGAGLTRGYWNKELETQESFRNGWFYTGDLGRMDDKGFMYIVGRKKDVIITGAENVFPAELENVLHTHPDIKEAAVIGLDNAKWGEIVTAFVVPRSDATLNPEQITSFCRKEIAGYKVPKKIFFMENLPLSPTGKLIKNKLKEQYNSESIFNIS